MTSSQHTVAIVGVGLIGGSIGLGLQKRALASRVIGIGRNPQRLQTAMDCGAVTETTLSIEDGVAEADLIVVGAPVEVIPELVSQIAASAPSNARITDVGSTKQTLVEQIDAQAVAGQAAFVGSHPLAGSEKTGVEHAVADLLVNRTVVVTPSQRTDAQTQNEVAQFWQQLGACVVTMSPAQHDAAVAITSHLPHVVASALAATTPDEYLPLVATGWRDTTRIAAGDVELWRQIISQNRTRVLQSVQEFAKVLQTFEQALRQENDAGVRELLATGKQQRDALAD